MSWVRLDDAFPVHRKVRRLSDAAFRMHISALCWSSKYLTDGHVAAEDIEMVADLDGHQDPQTFLTVTKELVQRGLWHEADHSCPSCPTAGDGWIIHDFLDLNPSSKQVQRQRQLATERQRRSRERRHDEETDDDVNGHADVTRDKRVSHGGRHAPVTAPHSHSHSPTQTPNKKRSSTTSTQSFDVVDNDFDRFWNAYPKRVAKGGARKAWTVARKKTDADTIINGAQRYRETVRNHETRFICTPAKWLNDERWGDEKRPEPARSDSGTGRSTGGFQPYRNPEDPDTAYASYRHRPRTHTEDTDDAA